MSVEQCYQLGWSFTPLDGKKPRLAGWQSRERESLDDALRWARRGNVGLRTGQASGGIVVIDLDAGGSVKDLNLLPTITASTGGGGKHYIFRYDKPLPNDAKGKLGPNVHVKADGGQVVFVGSVHPDTGRKYRWINGRAPGEIEIAELPARIVAKLTAPRVRQRLWSGNGEPIREGERNTTLCSLAGSMRKRGMSAETIEAALARENEQRCSPPLDADEVQRIAESVGRYPAGDDRKQFPLTDTGLAERFALQHGHDALFCFPWCKWLVWDGTRWKTDDGGVVEQIGKSTVRNLIVEAMAEEDVEKRKTLLAFARASESAARRDAMLRLARSEPPIPILPDALDKDIWLLNCPNGTLDLRSGELRPHCREDHTTKLCPTEYDPDAKCPRWKAVLDRVFGGNREVVRFVQRFSGYCLTGDVSEQILPIWHGTGANGKTTLLNAIMEALGRDYSMKGAADFLTLKRDGDHPTALTDLHGKRLVACSETDEGRRLAEALVKELTGGDPIRARRMREDFWQFMPTHKVILACNHRPTVRGTDHAIWRRIRLVPFDVTIPKDEQDKHLPAKLRAELPGILAWAVRGCLGWQKHGLGEPQAVIAATSEYQVEEDLLGAFIADRCTVGEEWQATAADLYDAYKKWAEATGEKPVTQTLFGRALNERGFAKYKPKKGPRKRKVVYRGIAPREEDETMPRY